MQNMRTAKNESVTAKAKAFGARAAKGLRRAMVSGVAIVVMMIAYGASTIGAIGTSALGITSAATVATLAATTTPASARRWRRRRRYYRGYYPYRRRRRRRGGVYLYF